MVFTFPIPAPVARNYDDLSRQELMDLLKARDRRDATRFGLVWESNEVERDRALNADYVSLELDPELSTAPMDSEGWRNLIVEGDNFDALRALKPAFSGRVKCICIDPPYNTGNRDFVYNDRFVDKEDSWRHSRWCEFMYQRLTLAKELLAADGAIFVHIDDNEIASLRLLMNQVFGEKNFIATFIWKKVDSPNDNKVSITPDHEFIVCFVLNSEENQFSQMAAPGIVAAYGSVDEMGRRCRDRLLKKNGKNSLRKDRPTMYFGLTAPDGSEVFPTHDNGEEARWAMGKGGVERCLQEGVLIWKKRTRLGREVWEPYTREFAPEEPTRPYPTIWSDLPTMRQAKAMLREIFSTSDLFSTPKPVELIERILQTCCGPDDIVLDFFAGSGTTAHAVLNQNATDGGRRRFILVSSTEATEEEPKKNLCRDVCAERVRRVIAGYADKAGIPGDFAYLRSRRISEGELLDIPHEQVWTALQLIHRETLEPYAAMALHWREDEDGALVYVERLASGTLADLAKRVRTVPAARVYAWQPGVIRARLADCEHVEVEPIPQSLARRFGFKVEEGRTPYPKPTA